MNKLSLAAAFLLLMPVLAIAGSAKVTFSRLDPETGKMISVTRSVPKGGVVSEASLPFETLWTPRPWLVRIRQCPDKTSKDCIIGTGTLVQTGSELQVLTDFHLVLFAERTYSIELANHKRIELKERGTLWLDPSADLVIVPVERPNTLEPIHLAEFDAQSRRFRVRYDLAERYFSIAGMRNSLPGTAGWADSLRTADFNDLIPFTDTERKGDWEKKSSLTPLARGLRAPVRTRAGDYLIQARLGPGASGLPLIGRDQQRHEYFIRGVFQKNSRDFERAYCKGEEAIARLVERHELNTDVVWTASRGILFPVFPGGRTEMNLADSPAGGGEANGGGGEANGGGDTFAAGGPTAWESFQSLVRKGMLKETIAWGSDHEVIAVQHPDVFGGKPVYADQFSLSWFYEQGWIDSAQVIHAGDSLLSILNARSGSREEELKIEGPKIHGSCSQAGCRLRFATQSGKVVTMTLSRFQSIVEASSEDGSEKYLIDLRDFFFVYLGMPDRSEPLIRIRRMGQELNPFDTEELFPVKIRP